MSKMKQGCNEAALDQLLYTCRMKEEMRKFPVICQDVGPVYAERCLRAFDLVAELLEQKRAGDDNYPAEG